MRGGSVLGDTGAGGGKAAIRTSGLVRRFGESVAVDGVDLEVGYGEIYGFLGPNGAGKTTTVRMLVTLLAPTEGEAWVAGHDVVREPGAVRLRIGWPCRRRRSTTGRPGSRSCGFRGGSTVSGGMR